MIKLVLLRHGESQWNLENRFTGWTDVDLTEKGELEAKTAGKVLKENRFEFDLVYTSVLQRAIKTMEICLSENDEQTTDSEWELISFHALPKDVNCMPMGPVTMMRNQLELPGGTKANYKSEDWAKSVDFWQHYVSLDVSK